MPKCRNPECGKDVPDGRSYCNDNCAERHIELMRAKREKRPEAKSGDSTIEAVLKYMGIEKQNFTKDVAYRHWEKFVEFVKEHSCKSWNGFIRPRLRSYVGIDYRYLDDFLESCISWGIMKLVNGCLIFIGIPEEGSQQ